MNLLLSVLIMQNSVVDFRMTLDARTHLFYWKGRNVTRSIA